MSAILLDGGIVHYEVLGRGRPIIFLHGWVGSWRYWINAMQAASTNFRAYAIDLWGYGDSARDPGRYTLDQQVLLVRTFLDQMGIARVALVGHGLGALVALGLSNQRPESVDRVMAVTCPLDSSAVHERLRNALIADLVDWLSSRTPAAQSALADAMKADPQALFTSFVSLESNDLFGKITRLTTPGLLVNGQDDPAIGLPADEQIEALPDNLHQIVLEGSGHFPMIDDTNGRFQRLLNDFLTLNSGTSPRELQLREEWKRRIR